MVQQTMVVYYKMIHESKAKTLLKSIIKKAQLDPEIVIVVKDEDEQRKRKRTFAW